MKFAVITSALLVGTMAQAGSLEYDFRFDSDNTQWNSGADGSGGTGSATTSLKKDGTKFTVQTGRLDYKGKLNDDISYRLRARFNRDQDTVNTNSGTNSTIDYASMTHKLQDNLSLTVGKFGSDMAGFEGATSGADIYFKSQAYRDLDYKSGTTFGTISSTNSDPGARYANVLFVTGAKLAYSYDNNEVAFTVAGNSDATENQTKPLAGLVWKGKYLDKALSAIVSYHTQSADTSTSYEKYNLATLGLKYDVGAWYAQLDYDMFTYVNASKPKDDTTTSAVVEAGYKMDKALLKAKLESSTVNTGAGTQAKYTYTGMGLAYEYKPYADTNFRYHVAYTTRTISSDATATYKDRGETHAIAGIRMVGDFLK